MSRQYHDCPPMHARKSFLPDVQIGTGNVGWDLSVEEYGFQIRFCPFCGTDLEMDSQVSLCGEPGPFTQPCDREKGHDGPHRTSWTGTLDFPGFKHGPGIDPPPSDKQARLTGHEGAPIGPGQARPMIQMTYKHIHYLGNERRTVEEILNEHGRNGWILGHYERTASGGITLILARPAPSSSEGKVT